MSAQGLFSIGGIASGLDTNDIVNQLMQLERQPVVRLEQRQANLRATKDAWGQINIRLSALRNATDQLRRADRFSNLTSISSSDPDAVSVTGADGFKGDAKVSFVVEQLATAMQRTSADTFASRDASLDGRQLTITGAGGTFTSDLGAEATLRDLVGAINDADIGVRAMALPVGTDQFQLVLDATDEGAGGTFTVDDATGWSAAFDVSQAAQNAQIRVGNVVSEWGSNTITDLIEGATITLNRTTDTAVTVTAERDVNGAVAAVKSFVDAANATLKTISELTAYDAETGKAGRLQGQFAATQLVFSLRSAVTAPVEGLTGSGALASSVGLRVERDGTISLDEARLRQAFSDDFDATARRFSRAGSVDDPDAATSVAGSRTTAAGTYDVEISAAADIARAIGGVYGGPPGGEPKAFTVITPSGKSITIRIDTDQTSAAQAAALVQQKLDEAEVSDLSASATDDGRLTLSSTGYGSSTSFTVQEVEVDAVTGEVVLDGDGDPIAVGDGVTDFGSAFGLEGTHQGFDVQGTINGIEATGTGRLLSLDDGPGAGLAITTVGGLDLGVEGSRSFQATFWHGIGGAMDAQLARAEGSTGSIARARSGIDSQLQIYQDRIEGFEQRLESREVTLRRQFVALETAIARFNSQGEWLAGQISQLTAINAQAAQRR